VTFQVDLFWSFRSPYSYLATPRLVEMRRGHGLAFIHEVGQLTFGGVKGWHEGDHLAGAAARAGLDLAEMDAAITSDPASYEAEIERNEADQKAAGHWGVPLMVFRGEPFFGQDRIDVLAWRMQKAVLRGRG